MIVKIFKQGKSSGQSHVDYLFNEEKHEGFIPKLIKGNRFLTEEVLSNISNRIKNKYCSGVISFRENEELNSNQLQELMHSFERTFAPFDDPGRANFLWVQHRDKVRNELHFICAQTDLKTEKAFSLHPNSKTTLLHFEHWTRLQNYKHGFEQVDKKEYFKSNYNFSVKLVKDLTIKKANFFSSRYCEKKSVYYNSNKQQKGKTNGKSSTSLARTQNGKESIQSSIQSTNINNSTIGKTEYSNQEHTRQIVVDRTERSRNDDSRPPKSEINNVRDERKVQQSTRKDTNSTSKIESLKHLPLEKRKQELIALMSSSSSFDEQYQLMDELIKITGQINAQIGEEPKKQNKFKI